MASTPSASAVVLGDFNDDGYADLAIGAFGEDDYAGSMTIFYGSTAGITTAGAQKFDAGIAGPHVRAGWQ